MANVVIPFLMSMLLGRTIDLTTYSVGGDIYDHDDYDESPLNVLNSTYTVLQENVLPYSHIGLPADLVLRIKSDYIHSSSGTLGLDGLLKETSWKSNSVVIAVTSMFQTVYRELKSSSPLLSNWMERIDSDQTHYAHSLVYGGWSAILYRFRCEVPGEEEIVREILTSQMGVSGTMDGNAVESLQKAMKALEGHKDLKGEVELQVRVFSSVRHSEDATTPEKMLKAIQKFPEDVGTLGQPLFVELKPLHKLNSRYPKVSPNHELEKDMVKIDELFDDLRIARAGLRKWTTETLTDFSEEEEKQISHLLDHVTRCVQLFHHISGEASIYKPMDPNLRKAAVLQYDKGLKHGGESYRQLFLRLKEDIDANCEDDFGHGIGGVLSVDHNEKLQMGEVSGLAECKTLCIEEPKCRAIGYADYILKVVTSRHNNRLVKENKQCWIYFKSTKTADLVSLEKTGNPRVYDRKCL